VTYVATGHYCKKRTRSQWRNGVPPLAGADNKDQSYFLSIVARAIIQIFISYRLTNLKRTNCCSNGISDCRKERFSRFVFIGKVRLPEFCNKNCSQKEEIIQIDKKRFYICR
jgi:tRNA U34 2-thiouridine synthase MnmA/TrmU